VGFNRCYIHPIPKKGVASINNSRPIALLETSLKVITRVVARRLMHHPLFKELISPCQFGFLPGRSSTDPFHILLGAVEDAKENGNPFTCALST
jgi:hypothetical protein